MGDLARTLLSEKIRTLVHARRSGILVVSSEEVTKGVFFRGGQIVFASSTLENDKLGESLIRLGRISRAEFAAAYEATQQRKRRLGQELVGAGLLTEEDLARLVAHQVQKIVLSLFTWKEGDMVFQEAPEPIPADLALDLSTHRLLLEGARIFPDAARLEKALGRQSRRLRICTRPPFDYSHLTLTPAEKGVLNDAADELRISEMLARPASRGLVVRAIYALLAGGILEEAAEEEEEAQSAPSLVEADTGSFKVAVAAAEEPPSADRKQQVLRLYEALPRATHYEVLGVPPDADPAAITASRRRLAEEEQKDWGEVRRDVRLGPVIGTLRLRRQEAFRVLSDPQSRQAYDRSLGAMRAPKAPGVTPNAQDRAVRLLKEALALLEAGEREKAVPLLLEGVEADPRDVTCRRVLALTLAQHRTLFRTAERHFLAALEMEPGDLETRYRFALYYKRAGLPKRAVAQLQAVLAAQPRHEGARRELKALVTSAART